MGATSKKHSAYYGQLKTQIAAKHGICLPTDLIKAALLLLKWSPDVCGPMGDPAKVKVDAKAIIDFVELEVKE